MQRDYKEDEDFPQATASSSAVSPTTPLLVSCNRERDQDNLPPPTFTTRDS